MRQDFTTWLLDQRYRKDLVGEIADLAYYNNFWPQTDYKIAFLVFFHQENATSLVRHAFELAYHEWQESAHLPAINVVSTVNLSLSLS